MCALIRCGLGLMLLLATGCLFGKTVRIDANAAGEPTYNGKPVEDWLRALQDPDAKVREKAVGVFTIIAKQGRFGSHSDAVAQGLASAVSDKEPAIREGAVASPAEALPTGGPRRAGGGRVEAARQETGRALPDRRRLAGGSVPSSVRLRLCAPTVPCGRA